MTHNRIQGEPIRMKPTEPTRRLTGAKPARYVPAVKTDVRRTWRRARLLAFLRRDNKE